MHLENIVTEYMVRVVMKMYEKANVVVVVDDGIRSRQSEVKVGVHQGSVLSPLLFICVIDE